MSSSFPKHGGNIFQEAQRLGFHLDQILDASSSLVPFPPPRFLRRCLKASLNGGALRNYPDRTHQELRQVIANWHGIEPSMVLPGNGASELLTWVARDATETGMSTLPAPCFADYERALNCWSGSFRQERLPLSWSSSEPQSFPLAPHSEVIWITNPHNPTGQLWSRESLRLLLDRYSLVICDEAFLSLVPGGEKQSLIGLVKDHSNLVVIRSLTKLFAVAGLRLGYAVADSKRLEAWQKWRDPWPLNGLAIAAGTTLMTDVSALEEWIRKVQNWVTVEGSWLQERLHAMPGIFPHPSSVNFLLIHGRTSLLDFHQKMSSRGVLLRDCRSFVGLGESWLRIGLQNRAGNRRIVSEMKKLLI